MTDSLRVGYVPYSSDFSHPGDRRRIVSWARANNLQLEVENPYKSDLLVLSANANLNKWIKKAPIPVVLDLVDGYIGEKPPIIKDLLRNIIRSFRGRSQFRSITYTRFLTKACKKANGIIVASQEQKDDLLELNTNVFVIPDNMFELNSSSSMIHTETNLNEKFILWEGFGYTVKHFKAISHVLDGFLESTDFFLILVTEVEFPRWGGYIGKIRTQNLINELFPKSSNKVKIIPWSVENLTLHAERAQFSIIPIDLKDNFAVKKPENKLISMWNLGLPTLFSDIPSYVRVAKKSSFSEFCVSSGDWSSKLAWIKELNRREFQNQFKEFTELNYGNELVIRRWQNALESNIKK